MSSISSNQLKRNWVSLLVSGCESCKPCTLPMSVTEFGSKLFCWLAFQPSRQNTGWGFCKSDTIEFVRDSCQARDHCSGWRFHICKRWTKGFSLQDRRAKPFLRLRIIDPDKMNLLELPSEELTFNITHSFKLLLFFSWTKRNRWKQTLRRAFADNLTRIYCQRESCFHSSLKS